jgi:hypothetical protein
MGFPLLQKGIQIQVLGSYWTGCMSNEEANSLYKFTDRAAEKPEDPLPIAFSL